MHSVAVYSLKWIQRYDLTPDFCSLSLSLRRRHWAVARFFYYLLSSFALVWMLVGFLFHYCRWVLFFFFPLLHSWRVMWSVSRVLRNLCTYTLIISLNYSFERVRGVRVWESITAILNSATKIIIRESSTPEVRRVAAGDRDFVRWIE